MTTRLGALLLAIVTLPLAPSPAEAGCPGPFVELGGSAHDGGVSASSTSVLCQRVEVDRQSTPFALWADTSSGKREVYLRRWDGTAWTGLDGSDVDGGLSGGRGANGMGLSCLGEVAFDSLNRPHVAWSNYDGTLQSTYLARFNGTRWEELAGSASGGGLSGGQLRAFWPQLTIDALDQLTVSWTSGPQLYARRWNGTQWLELAGSATKGIANAPALVSGHSAAAGPPGQSTVAWEDLRNGVAAPEVHLLRWDGAAWTGLGPSDGAGGLGPGGKPSVVTDPMDQPIAAWEADPGDGGLVIRAARWNGAAWLPLDSPPLAGGKPQLALHPDGELYLAYEQESPAGTAVRLAHYSNSTWQDCPLGLPETGRQSWPELAIGPDGQFVLGWFEEVQPGQLQSYLVRSQPPTPPTPPAPSHFFPVGCGCSTPGFSPLLGLLLVLWRRR